MDMAQRNGPMVQFTWANLRTVCGMDKVRWDGLTAKSTKADSWMVLDMERASLRAQMVNFMKAIIETDWNTERVCINGWTVVFM